MSEVSEPLRVRRLARLQAALADRRRLVFDYLSAISGAAGRLVFSLAYFVALANTLTIPEFGLFATASAAGVMLSRILAFGFISTLYRIATVRPRLLGTFTGGFLVLGLLSLPALAAASWLVHQLFFVSQLSLGLFALVIAAEALLWRPAEAIVIVNNGMGRFGRSAILVIIGTVMRAVAAVLFMFAATPDLATWCIFYLAANAVTLAVGLVFFLPRQELRLRMPLYWKRLPDSLYVAGAELLFYLQMEFDKLLVLAYGGPKLAGIYAIVMRLVDLTAIPIRTFTMMLVQQMMRTPDLLARIGRRIGIEAGILVISTLAMLTLALTLHFFPNALGGNVAEAVPLIGLVLLVPGLRNLVEYHAELLFARGQTLTRALNLALLAAAKAVLLIYILTRGTSATSDVVWSLNAAFAVLYLVSMVLTYSALRLPARKI